MTKQNPSRFLGAMMAFIVGGLSCKGRAPQGDAERTRAVAADLAGAEGASHPTPDTSSGGSSVAELDLTRGLPEVRTNVLLGPPSQRSYVDLVRALRDLTDERDRVTKGVLVRLGGASIGLARAQEVGALLGVVRTQKTVVCHADELNNGSMLLAAKGCSRIWVSPAGAVETVGIAAHLLYAHRLLERLNVGVDFLQAGKYKGAEEPFTRDGPSPEARQSIESALRGMRAGWLADIGIGRSVRGAVERVEDGPFSPEEARAAGLIDAVGDIDDARDEVKKRTGTERVSVRFGGSEGSSASSFGLVGVLRALAGSSRGGVPHVAVVPASGSITMSSSSSLLGPGDGITEHDLGRVLSRLTSDPSTKAVVLRVDSPGGSALASDLLWKKLMKLRAEKTLVVSIGDMAASGGYYLACAGTKIVAEPTSLLGSIGVVGGKLAVGPALEEIGVHGETIAASPDPRKAARSSYLSTVSPWDDATRERVRSSITSTYHLFLSRVAEGRSASIEAIEPSAEGRVYGGVEAKDRGMIDEIGGLSDAIDLALKLANLPKETPIEVVRDEPGFLGFLDEGQGSGDVSNRPLDFRAYRGFAAGMSQALPGGHALLGALEPLLSGERAVAAVPFGLVVK